MNHSQIFFVIPISIFYISYIVKMLILRTHGIRGYVLGKGNKSTKETIVDTLIRMATFAGIPIQYGSIIWFNLYKHSETNIVLWAIGLFLVMISVAFFIDAIIVMKDNWRAGYNDSQNTILVTKGIYKHSRNPAFVGFDLLYIGCAIAYPNLLIIIWSVLVLIAFHLQILGEERFLRKKFGHEYEDYMKKVSRYFIIF